VIPAIVIVFGYIRLYNTSSWLPLTGSAMGTNILLMFGYATLSLPYMYRAVDTGLRTIDVATLTEAAQSLGAGWVTILARIILPNVLVAILSGAFVTFAIVMGEFTMAALLNRPAFGPYMQLLGANRAYEPAALAVIAFGITWACMGLIQLVTRFSKPYESSNTDGISGNRAPGKIVRQPAGGQGFQPEHRAGRVRLTAGAFGLRQDHGAADGGGVRDAVHRHDPH